MKGSGTGFSPSAWRRIAQCIASSPRMLATALARLRSPRTGTIPRRVDPHAARCRCRLRPRGRVRLNTTVGVRKCVLADLGVAIASEWMFAPELRDKTVKAVLADWSLPLVEAWALFPAGRQTSAKARTFASFIESQMLNCDRFQQQMGAEN